MLEGCWQRALAVAMLFAFVVWPSWSSALDYKRNLSLLSSQWQAQSWGWGSRTIMDWFHGENAAWCPLRLKRRKKLLKTCPQIKHNKAQEWSLDSSPVFASHQLCLCCLLQCLVLPVPAQQTAEMRLSSSDLLLSPELLRRLVLNSYFCASSGGGCHLVSLTPSAGQGAAGRCAVRQKRCGILSTPSPVLHKWHWKSIPAGPHLWVSFWVIMQ